MTRRTRCLPITKDSESTGIRVSVRSCLSASRLLEELIEDRNELKMVALMKEIVPEFKSNYSRFEVLDGQSSLR